MHKVLFLLFGVFFFFSQEISLPPKKGNKQVVTMEVEEELGDDCATQDRVQTVESPFNNNSTPEQYIRTLLMLLSFVSESC